MKIKWEKTARCKCVLLMKTNPVSPNWKYLVTWIYSQWLIETLMSKLVSSVLNEFICIHSDSCGECSLDWFSTSVIYDFKLVIRKYKGTKKEGRKVMCRESWSSKRGWIIHSSKSVKIQVFTCFGRDSSSCIFGSQCGVLDAGVQTAKNMHNFHHKWQAIFFTSILTGSMKAC